MTETRDEDLIKERLQLLTTDCPSCDAGKAAPCTCDEDLDRVSRIEQELNRRGVPY